MSSSQNDLFAFEVSKIDDETVWDECKDSCSDQLISGLKELEGTLRCPICVNFFQSPVSLHKCHHTFCSECIQNHFSTQRMGIKRENQCPQCNEQADLNKLIPNRTLGDAIRAFQPSVRPLLKQTLKKRGAASAASSSDQDHDEVESEYDDEASNDDAKSRTRAARKGRHPAPPPQRLRRKAPVIYNMKRKQLVKMCEDEGISSQGTDSQLKERHKEWVTFWNAESDSYHPRSRAELLKLFRERQAARLDASRSSESRIAAKRVALLNQSRAESNGDSVTSGNPEFDARLEQGFVDLVKKARRRQKPKEESPSGDAAMPSSALAAAAPTFGDSAPPEHGEVQQSSASPASDTSNGGCGSSDAVNSSSCMELDSENMKEEPETVHKKDPRSTPPLQDTETAAAPSESTQHNADGRPVLHEPSSTNRSSPMELESAPENNGSTASSASSTGSDASHKPSAPLRSQSYNTRRKRPKRSNGLTKWECPHCSFHNTASIMMRDEPCAMCSFRRTDKPPKQLRPV